MNKKYLYGLSALMLVSGMATMTSCQSEEDLIGGGQKVMLTISADKQDEATRTQFTPSGKDLNSVWTAGDQLLITTHSGIAGVVTLSSGAGTASGVFKGEVTLSDNGEDEIALFYLGKGVDPANVKDKKYIIDLSSQTDNLEGLAEKDFLATTTLVKNMNGTATASVAMNRLVDEAYFTLALPDGLTLGEGDVVTISGDNMTVGRAITLSKTSGDVWDWDNTAANQVTGSITVTKTSEMGNALYFTMHGNQTVAPTFTVTKDGYRYTAAMGTAHTWNGSQFVNNNGEPIAVTDWTKEELPTDPGDFNNWGGENTEIKYTVGKLTKVATADGWVTNVDNYSHGGWGTYITYEQNAIIDGLLSSNESGSAFYFQWGRWLGFPAACVNTYFQNDDVHGHYPTSAQNLPGNPHNNLNIGYMGDSRLMATWCSGYMGANSSFTRQKAKEWSIMFAMVSSFIVGNYDYIYANEDCKWEDRSGNPCPDGYRLPSVAELETFIPSCNTIDGTYKEFKVINGERYAMQWTPGSDDTKYVEIKSVKSDATNISSVDFSGAPSIKLYAYGFIDSRQKPATRSSVGSLGMYWSNESGANTLSGTNGNGAKYLSVIFNGSEINFSIRVAPRTFGACVLPIKDSKAKSASVTPWFPMCEW